MPTLPWRFQADLTPDNPDPDVTVFVGDSITNDVTGVKTIHQDTANPEIVPLSELATYVATGLTQGITRTTPDEGGPTARNTDTNARTTKTEPKGKKVMKRQHAIALIQYISRAHGLIPTTGAEWDIIREAVELIENVANGKCELEIKSGGPKIVEGLNASEAR